jgi:hypothetical protein
MTLTRIAVKELTLSSDYKNKLDVSSDGVDVR